VAVIAIADIFGIRGRRADVKPVASGPLDPRRAD
jgi:hypothetical protein